MPGAPGNRTLSSQEPRTRLFQARRIALRCLPVAGFLVIVYLLVRTISPGLVLQSIAKANVFWLLWAAFLALLTTVMSAFRLSLFCRMAGKQVKFRACWSGVMASLTLNSVLPGRGGDFAKAFFIAKEKSEVTVFLGVTILERVVDVLALAMLALFASFIMGVPEAAWMAALALCFPLGAFAALGFMDRLPRWGDKLGVFGQATRGAMAQPRLLASGVGFSFLFWCTVSGIVGSLLRAVGADVPVGVVVASTPLAILVGIIPVTISGIGTRDGMLVFLLRDYAPAEQALAAGLLYTVIGYWMLAVFGLLSIGGKKLGQIRRFEIRSGDSVKSLDQKVK